MGVSFIVEESLNLLGASWTLIMRYIYCFTIMVVFRAQALSKCMQFVWSSYFGSDHELQCMKMAHVNELL